MDDDYKNIEKYELLGRETITDEKIEYEGVMISKIEMAEYKDRLLEGRHVLTIVFTVAGKEMEFKYEGGRPKPTDPKLKDIVDGIKYSSGQTVTKTKGVKPFDKFEGVILHGYPSIDFILEAYRFFLKR